MKYWQYSDLQTMPELAEKFALCIDDVLKNTATLQKRIGVWGASAYAPCFRLAGGELILASSVLEYYLHQWENSPQSLSFNEVQSFCDDMQKLIGWEETAPILESWCNRNLRDPYFIDKQIRQDKYHWDYVLKADIDPRAVPSDYLHFGCYIALSFRQHNTILQENIAKQVASFVIDLGFSEMLTLEQNGSGNLPEELQYYHDGFITFRANDATAMIRIHVHKEELASYEKVLTLLCELLKCGFPKSFCIDFKSRQKGELPLRGLPKKGVYRLFANAAAYPELWDKIEEYSRLAMHKGAWYLGLSTEDCAMPGTFAVLALATKERRYFPLIMTYMDLCDRKISSIQAKYSMFLVEHFGLDEETLPVLLHCICAYEGHRSAQAFWEAFTDEKALKLLLNVKPQILQMASADDIADYLLGYEPKEQPKALEEFAQLLWQHVLGVIFGKATTKKRMELVQNAPEHLKTLYDRLLNEPVLLSEDEIERLLA